MTRNSQPFRILLKFLKYFYTQSKALKPGRPREPWSPHFWKTCFSPHAFWCITHSQFPRNNYKLLIFMNFAVVYKQVNLFMFYCLRKMIVISASIINFCIINFWHLLISACALNQILNLLTHDTQYLNVKI